MITETTSLFSKWLGNQNCYSHPPVSFEARVVLTSNWLFSFLSLELVSRDRLPLKFTQTLFHTSFIQVVNFKFLRLTVLKSSNFTIW